jgi:hypothetical protein
MPKTQQPEPTKRTSFDMPADLHMRVKIECTRRGLLMCDVFRELLEREFPAEAPARPGARRKAAA